MMEFNYTVAPDDFVNAGKISSAVKKTLKQLNVSPDVIRRTVVALYEAEVNIVAHAYRGDVNVLITPEKITVILTDEGPGIPNIEQAMEKGYSTASPKVREMGFGAGMGLPNIKNNTDNLVIESIINKGTTLTFENLLS